MTDKENIQRIKEKSDDDFEKYLTLISTGGLALSLTFVEKIIPFKESSSIFLLIIGWGLLTLTLLISLCSHFCSSYLAEKSIEELDDDDPKVSDNITKRNKKIIIANVVATFSLILGITFIVIFVSTNAIAMSKQQSSKPIKTSTQQKGRTIPKPKTPPKKK